MPSTLLALALILLLVTQLWVGASVSLANPLEPALKATAKTNNDARRSQDKIDAMADAGETMRAELDALLKEIAGLEVYNEQLGRQIEDQAKELIKVNAAIDQVAVIERQILPLMLRMISLLEEFVVLDIPFDREARLERVNNLKTLMDRSDVTASEKFRKVMEAYTIENDFGHTISHYPGSLTIDGQPLEVDFLRIGRITLVYQSLDGEQIGIWNKYLGAWQSLSDVYKPDIRRGLKIAQKKLTPKLIELPIPAPEVAR